MSSISKIAAVEQDAPSKIPILLPGDMTPTVMRQFEHACYGYFDTKDIAADRQVHKVLTGLCNSCMQDWVAINCDELLAMSFKDFMIKFKAAYLPKDWEEITRIELLQMSQGSISFWDFSVDVLAKNSLLTSTPSHLNDKQLRHRIESGMNTTLALRSRLEKVVTTGTLNNWMNEIKRVDDLICAEHVRFEAIAKASRELTRHSNVLADPSCRANTNLNQTVNNNSTTSTIVPRVNLPKLTSVECQLLFDNEGCLKCH
jgi:hypothetical protein